MKQVRPIITLTGENNQSLDFYIEAELEYEGYSYVVLKPVDENLGISIDEAIVFRVEGNNYEIEYDDEIIDAISNIYNAE
ncbi:MAG: DUF1292 domain-containing protein [Anaeroplasma sp.]